MCQVTPFTLPCCRRVYVSISKLPSCPDSWPKAKCPPELCIQVRGLEPDERSASECWRCKADAAGKSESEKEKLRPAIDHARIVLGEYYELGVEWRRQAVEEGGHCWFCNARGGCSECGAKEIKAEDQPSRQHREETPSKKRHREGRVGRDRTIKKRIKGERSEGTPSTPGSVYSLPRAPTSDSGYSLASPTPPGLMYHDPNTPQSWNPGSPYTPNQMYSASPSYEAFDPQTLSPPNQHHVFTPTSSSLWQTTFPHQYWANHTDHSLPASQATGTMLSGTGGVTYVPQEEMHRIVNPNLLQPKLDPDLTSTPVPSSRAQWESNLDLQHDYEELDPATFNSINEEFQHAYENEMQRLEDEDDARWG